MSCITPLRALMCALLVLAGAAGAQAQTLRSISGSSLQYFLGQNVPIPHPSFGPWSPPFVPGVDPGGAKATPYAWATTSNAGATIWIPSPAISHNGPGNPQLGINQPGLFFAGVFQIYTNFEVSFPVSGAHFSVSGRTGPDVVTWCPGQTSTVALGVNPMCGTATRAGASVTLPSCVLGSCPGAGMQMLQLHARARYQRTAGQLGGPALGIGGGTFNIALNLLGGASPPPSAPVCFVGGSPSPVIGGAFGLVEQNADPPLPCYTSVGGFTPSGAITGTPMGYTPLVVPNYTLASFGLPFTGGQLTLTATMTGQGGTSMFTLTGSDTRTAGGAGNITLVGGAVSLRSASGRTANPGILQVTLPEPAAIAGFTAALLALLACHRLARSR